ncbi:hypothetical protein QAD02_011794 [Eretmocerus hayati]|uniref:Uncharacterized protein n=1 Tax=Eretmocerus hayati TaxID=131215 RepID=A0ACC2NYT5_9HYME|nr:hypothetical protein QAD02_011794 [Eretmocerus hayati]
MTQTDQDSQGQEAQQPSPQPPSSPQSPQSPQDQECKKESTDKKEIAEEEREKMLNEENSKHTGAPPNPELEAEERKPKRKMPIGGIKLPGFCRSKSKEPCKLQVHDIPLHDIVNDIEVRN